MGSEYSDHRHSVCFLSINACFLFKCFPHSAQISTYKDKSSSVPPLISSNGVSVASQPPVPTPQKTQRNECRAQLSDCSESVRQMLQDEMFKLVQVSTSL